MYGRRAVLKGAAVVLTLAFSALPIAAFGGSPESPSGGTGQSPGAETAAENPGDSASVDYGEERRQMVRRQIEDRGVQDTQVLQAMRSVPRHRFVSEGRESQAYADRPLPIGQGQTISQPYIVAYMTEVLELEAGDRVLEIGTGSGYQAAVLAEITDQVYSIEIIDELADQAGRRLEQLGYDEVRTRRGDGYYGWEEAAPFDAIIVTAAAGHIPPPLIDQLKPDGRMVIPIGGTYEVQSLMLVRKQDGGVSTKRLMPVRFVPMTGAVRE
jgi:protein-L-isoaspartate(D-aspartate) O-methyltransferase